MDEVGIEPCTGDIITRSFDSMLNIQGAEVFVHHLLASPVFSVDANAMPVELVDVVAPVCRPISRRAGHASGTSELAKLPGVPALAIDLDLDVVLTKLPVVHDLWRISSRNFTT